MPTPRDPDAPTRAAAELPPALRDDAWQDRDGTIHTGAGPYEQRWTRRLRRLLRPRSRGWIR